MRKSKLFLAITVLLSVTFLVGACSNNSSSNESTKAATTKTDGDADTTEAAEGTGAEATKAKNEPSGEAVEIDIAWWGGEARHEKFNEILDLYEAQNPNITFVRQYAPWNDYWTKLTTQSASNSLPDTFGMTSQYKGEFYARDVMEPLGPYVESGQIDLSNFSEGALNAAMVNDDMIFVTFGDTVSGLAYNKTLIESIGMDLPKAEMTYTEYIAYAKELKEKLPEGVYASTYNWEHQFENHVRQFGTEIVNEDGTAPGYTKETLKSYFEFNKELLDSGAGAPPEVSAENTGKQWVDSLEGTGKMAMYQTNINQLKIYQAQTEDELGAVRGLIADGATHKYVEQIQPSGWTIFTGSKVKDQVAEFINFYVNDEEVQQIFYMDLGVPGSSVIQDMIVEGLTDSLVDNTISIEIGLMQEIAGNVEPHPGRREGTVALWTDITAKWDEILFGTMTVDEAVDAHFASAGVLLS